MIEKRTSRDISNRMLLGEIKSTERFVLVKKMIIELKDALKKAADISKVVAVKRILKRLEEE